MAGVHRPGGGQMRRFLIYEDGDLTRLDLEVEARSEKEALAEFLRTYEQYDLSESVITVMEVSE